MPKPNEFEADALDELKWRLMAELSSVEVSKLLAHHTVNGTRLLVVLAADTNGKQIEAIHTTRSCATLVEWYPDGALGLHTPCFYCARPATHRDLLTHNQVCANCAAGQSHHEPL